MQSNRITPSTVERGELALVPLSLLALVPHSVGDAYGFWSMLFKQTREATIDSPCESLAQILQQAKISFVLLELACFG